jgi:hypothetical protein
LSCLPFWNGVCFFQAGGYCMCHML